MWYTAPVSNRPGDDSTQPVPGDLIRFTADELFPLVYEELRRLAAARLARDGRAGLPMQPTSLVHSAYLRLVQDAAEKERAWDGRGHFFAAAALAMRRILVERARQRGQLKRGAQWKRLPDFDAAGLPGAGDTRDDIDVIALDRAMEELERYSSDLYQVVMLRYFAGLSLQECASSLGLSAKTVQRRWSVARLWLLDRIESEAPGDPPGPGSTP